MTTDKTCASSEDYTTLRAQRDRLADFLRKVAHSPHIVQYLEHEAHGVLLEARALLAEVEGTNGT